MKVFSIKVGRLTDYVNCVSIFMTRNTNKEVVWLDVTIDQRLIVNRLDSSNLHDWKNVSARKFG